jgi:hypothetical protein
MRWLDGLGACACAGGLLAYLTAASRPEPIVFEDIAPPYTLAYLAGHSDFSATKRDVQPQAESVRAPLERVRGVRGGHSFEHS